MLAVDEDHVVAQVVDVLGGLLRRSAVAEQAQQSEQLGLALAQPISIAQGDVHSAAVLEYALQMGKIGWNVQPEAADIFVVDEDFPAGHRQQAFDGSLIVAPGGDQFASHGD